MADYCQQCSIDEFGKDFKELAGITKPEDAAKNLYAIVICEGCGPTQVDPDGKCVSDDCICHGHKPEATGGGQ